MTITKAELRVRVQQLADAVDSSRWDADPNGEIDQHIGVVMDREWKRILNANPFYRIVRQTPTSDADGYYAVDDLSSGSGDTEKRLYRVVAFSVDSTVYEEGRVDDWLIPGVNSPSPQYLWYFEGDQIMALPVQASKQALVIVNWLPPRQDMLSGETITIDFPDGYENVIAWDAAAMLLNKAGSEASRAQVLAYQAEALRQDMLQDLMRRSTAPVRMRYTDSASDYAG